MSVSDLQRDFSSALRLQLTQNWIEAECAYRRLIERAPNEPVLPYNLGLVLKAKGQFRESAEAFRAALRLNPSFPEAANNLGTTLTALGELDEAIQILDTCTRAHPHFAEAFNNLGDAQKDRGEIESAVLALQRAVQLQPDNPAFLSNLIYALHYHPESTPASLRAIAETWGQRFNASATAPASVATATGRKRIGYIGAFFRVHCQSLFLVPLLSHHHRDRYEIFCYSDDRRSDAVTSRLRGYSDHWQNIAGKSTTEIAAMISADQLDMLIDLGLHTAQNYLPVFALRPAPRQVSWLGYPGTTGLAAMSERLSDPFLDPPGEHDGDYTETTLRLPHTFWCYDPIALTGNSIPLGHRSDETPITLGCLNNFCKVNDQVLALWRRVLDAIPNSRFVLMAPRGSARTRVREQLGLNENHIEFFEFAPRDRYLERYQSIDLCLDTYPYNGHTTSLDALWMGVPVVTLCGKTAVSRAGYSLLANLDLTELVAHNT
ncbi:MAG TPA: tetratricopeptide repeat protein, partial [Opitutaceae bacterium]